MRCTANVLRASFFNDDNIYKLQLQQKTSTVGRAIGKVGDIRLSDSCRLCLLVLTIDY